MNAVEGFFFRQSRQRLNCAILYSLDECVAAIKGRIQRLNAGGARPLRWSRKPENHVEAWIKGRRKLQESAS